MCEEYGIDGQYWTDNGRNEGSGGRYGNSLWGNEQSIL